MMAKCPSCGKNGRQLKRWVYGPKTRKGQTFDVIIYQCESGHKWREYQKKK